MTTIAVKDGVLVADGQVSAGNLICNTSFKKVRKFQSQQFGSIYVAAAGTLSHIVEVFDFIEHVFNNSEPDGIKFSGEHFQVLLLDEEGDLYEGLLTEASTSINWIECEQPWAIGSGSQIALGAMKAGKSAEEAVLIASQYDAFTNDVLQVYHVKDLSYKAMLQDQKRMLEEQLEAIEQAESMQMMMEDLVEDDEDNSELLAKLSDEEIGEENDKSLLGFSDGKIVEDDLEDIPLPDAHGWFENTGKVVGMYEIPPNLSANEHVEVVYNDGTTDIGEALDYDWTLKDEEGSVVKYRLVERSK